MTTSNHMYDRTLTPFKITVFILCLSVLAVLFFIARAFNPVTRFEDSGLENAIRTKLNNPDRPIHNTDLFFITELDASDRHIKSLRGIEHLRRLTSLNLDFNRVEDLSPLAQLPLLTDLSLRQNYINNLEAVSFGKLINLRLLKLDMRDNDLVQIELLGEISSLEYLNLHSNRNILSLEALGSLKNLQTLILRNVPIGDQSAFLRGLPKLRRLNVRNTSITDIDFLESMPLLDSADLRDNLSPVEFSSAGGFYREGFQLEITARVPGCTIYYTLDGSVPDPANVNGIDYFYKNIYPENPGNMSGELKNASYRTFIYTGPLMITDRSQEADELTNISSTYQRIPDYFPGGPVFKGTVVRAVALKDSLLISPVKTCTYFISPEGNERYSLPVISISVNEGDLFDYERGIYVAGADFEQWRSENPGRKVYKGAGANYQRDTEVPVHFELFEPDGRIGLSMDLGMKVHGGWTMAHPMKSLRFYVRDRYGEYDVIEYQFFPHCDRYLARGSDRHHRVILRMGGNSVNSLTNTVAQRIMAPTAVGAQRNLPVVYFVNGEYWGLGNITDRPDSYFLSEKYGLDRDSLVILHAPWGKFTDGALEAGTAKDSISFNDLQQIIVKGNLNNPKTISRIREELDLISYFDCQIMFIYLNSKDWHGYRHFKFWRSGAQGNDPFEDGKWRLVTWDFDNSMNNPEYDYLPEFIKIDLHSSLMLSRLLATEEFRNQFINRFADHLNTTFLPERIVRIVEGLIEELEPELEEDFERWGGWYGINYQADPLISFACQRPDYQRMHIRRYFGIERDVHITLDVNGPGMGYIRINTIEIREGTAGIAGEPYPWSGIYFQGIPVELEAVPMPGYAFKCWMETGEVNPVLTVVPDDDARYTAVFFKTR